MDRIMDAEVSAQNGAMYVDRTPYRVTHRNGYRTRSWDTRVGTMDPHRRRSAMAATSPRC